MAKRVHTVETEVLTKNIKALLAYHNKTQDPINGNSNGETDAKKKLQLFESVPNILFQIDFAMKPNLKNKTFLFEIEFHPKFDASTSEVCLIVKDDKEFQKKYDTAKYDQKNEELKKFKKVCPFVSAVLPHSVIKSDYKTFEQKRILCNSFDFFIADRDIFHTLPGLLGGYFIKQKKMPRKIDNLTLKNDLIKQKLLEKLSKITWFVDGRGTCTSVMIGKADWEIEKILKNAEQILEQIAENSPRGWNFIKSVHVKLENSIALEVYRKNENLKIPVELADMEKNSMARENMEGNDLYESYKNLVKNQKVGFSKKKEKNAKNLKNRDRKNEGTVNVIENLDSDAKKRKTEAISPNEAMLNKLSVNFVK